MPIRRFSLALLGAVLIGSILPSASSAQYFGRNKVQYEDFDFRVLATDHFKVYYYPEEREAAEDAARMAERWYSRHSDAFQHAFQEKKPIVLYANHADFEQTNTLGGFQSEATGGVTEGLKDRVVLPLASNYHDTDHVMGHELVHAFQYDLAQSRTGPGMAAMNRVPLWMIEGMAEFLSVGRRDPNTVMWMRDAVLYDDFPSIKDLSTSGKYFPYRYGEALWAYIAGRYGDRAVPALYSYATTQGLEAATRRVLGISVDTLSTEWAAATRAEQQPVIAARTRPDSLGRLLIGPTDKNTGHQNLAPALSPDGRYLAFLSERGLFSIDLYLADAHTGKVLRRLTSSATNSHFDALSFMNAAGSFSPDSRQFAAVVFEDGDQHIVLLNTESGGIERTLKTPTIGAISDPAWSPDGTRIAFSGNKGGITDLYVYDLSTDEVRQLTNGREAEMQPSWSPDGNLLAYTTDAGDRTNFEMLTYSPMSIAVMDVTSGQTRLLRLFTDAKNINPIFSPDGQSLYFVSDHEGVSDIFRYALMTGQIFRVTNVVTGVSGLTDKSPALAMARASGELAFSVFTKQGFNIRSITELEAQGTPVEVTTDVATAAGVLPPVSAAGEGLIYSYLNDPTTGLVAASTFEQEPYHSALSLDMIAPPTIGVATSSFGTGLAGGVGAFFSDMLGNQQMAVAVQANGTFKDIGGMAQYVNLDDRWNWGGVVGRIPLLSAGQFVAIDQENPQFYDVETVYLRQYITQAQGLLQYPFSQTRRIEFNAGFTRYSYDIESDIYVVDPATGQAIARRREQAPSCSSQPGGNTGFFSLQCEPAPLNLVQASAAYVGDNAVFGFTSPIQGGRFRLEVSPTVGSLNFGTLLGDYRRYLFHYPFTLAFQGYHLGRYGPGAECDENSSDFTRCLNPLFLGYEWFVRGYSWDSFRTTGECSGAGQQGPGTFSGCPVVDQLFGSRVALAKLELRIPVFGVEQFGLINFPYLPTELSGFIDAGLAWGKNNPPHFRWVSNLEDLPSCNVVGDVGCRHVPVVSAGVSARVNVLGFMVLEAYYAYPFQRPDKGWHWGFQIQPGW